MGAGRPPRRRSSPRSRAGADPIGPSATGNLRWTPLGGGREAAGRRQ